MQEPQITPELVAAHGLKPDEYDRILAIIGREPSFTELGIFSAMWNEHCSYKSSKKWLRTLPTTGPQVICGPGENAGVVDIGDGQAVILAIVNIPDFPGFIKNRRREFNLFDWLYPRILHLHRAANAMVASDFRGIIGAAQRRPAKAEFLRRIKRL